MANGDATTPASALGPATAVANSNPTSPTSAPAADLPALAAILPSASYAEKRVLIKKIVETHDPRVHAMLAALLNGTLYARSSDGALFIVAEAAAGASTPGVSTPGVSTPGVSTPGEPAAGEPAAVLKLTDPLTGRAAGTAQPDDVSKIGVNNQLRKELRVALAQFDLASPEAAVRRAAVEEILRAVDPESIALLKARLAVEPSSAVKRAIRAGLALADLDSEDANIRLAAVKTLSDSLNVDVYNRLSAMTQAPASGEPGESDPVIRAAAQAALRKIDRQRSLYSIVQTGLYGLSQGSVLVLAAIGLAITFGVMGVINMAHGELMMLGAYSTYVVQLLMPHHIGASIVVAIPVAFAVSGLAGIAIERGIVRHLYGRPLETLLATFGVSLILQQAVRDIFSANNRPVETPPWLAGSLEINEVLSITYNRLYIIVFTFALFLLLLTILKRTRLGLEVRAVSQNRAMAKAMGIRTEWVDAMTFGLGSGIAGIAGVALSQLTNVGPNLGQSYIVDSFMVVVFGGVGNLWGTEIGGNALGVVNKVLEPYAGAVLAKIFVLVFLIIFIQRRPRGLFPQKGRAAEG
jgi:urea transport system permease protein